MTVGKENYMGFMDAGQSSGGSVNSAQSTNFSTAQSVANSMSRTYGSEATAKSYAEAIRADERQRRFMYETQLYNTNEAAKQRAWQEKMANTIYTRSVKNMIEAGINPVLAASAGLSAANVGSGAAASISVPSTFMGQTFPDVMSSSESVSNSYSEGQSNEKGSSWQESTYGTAIAFEQIGEMLENVIENSNAGKAVQTMSDGLNDFGEGVKQWMRDNLPASVQEALGIKEKEQKGGHSGGGTHF